MTAEGGALVQVWMDPRAADDIAHLLIGALRQRSQADATPLRVTTAAAVTALIHASAQSPTSPERSNVADLATLGSGDVARVLNCTPRWAQYLLKSGRLDSWRVGRTWVTTAAALDRFRFGEAAADDRPTEHDGGDQ